MRQFTIPIKSLPPELTGRIEVTETPAHHDWRDTAIGMAAVASPAVLALPYAYHLDPLGIVLGGGVLFYLMYAIEELRIFTRRDRVTFDAIVEYEIPASTPESSEAGHEHSPNVRVGMLGRDAGPHGRPTHLFRGQRKKLRDDNGGPPLAVFGFFGSCRKHDDEHIRPREAA